MPTCSRRETCAHPSRASGSTATHAALAAASARADCVSTVSARASVCTWNDGMYVGHKATIIQSSVCATRQRHTLHRSAPFTRRFGPSVWRSARRKPIVRSTAPFIGLYMHGTAQRHLFPAHAEAWPCSPPKHPPPLPLHLGDTPRIPGSLLLICGKAVPQQGTGQATKCSQACFPSKVGRLSNWDRMMGPASQG